MNKIELEIVSLQSSVTHMHSYAVVLGETNGSRKIPIVIGGFEAQAIAVALENLQPKRPLTHDLMVMFLDTFNITLKEVLIYRLEEAIFYSKLVCEQDDTAYEIDCRTSDAIALSIRTDCPIFATEDVVNSAGLDMHESREININEDTDALEDIEDTISMDADLAPKDEDLTSMTLEELEQYLEEVLEKEDYTTAIKIRDEIKSRGKA